MEEYRVSNELLTEDIYVSLRDFLFFLRFGKGGPGRRAGRERQESR